MISPSEIQDQFNAFLREGVEAADVGEYSALLTPIEYPGGDSVVVYIGKADTGELIATDLASAEAELLSVDFKVSKGTEFAHQISNDLDVRWDAGRFFQVVNVADEVGDVCWRVAQAASRMAGARGVVRGKTQDRDDFPDLLEQALQDQGIDVKRNQSLDGASGHTHKPAFFDPERELVIENISGNNSWPRAAAVLAEFTDLSQVNGFQFLAVIDDRRGDSRKQERNLLTTIAPVSNWSRRDDWIPKFN